MKEYHEKIQKKNEFLKYLYILSTERDIVVNVERLKEDYKQTQEMKDYYSFNESRKVLSSSDLFELGEKMIAIDLYLKQIVPLIEGSSDNPVITMFGAHNHINSRKSELLGVYFNNEKLLPLDLLNPSISIEDNFKAHELNINKESMNRLLDSYSRNHDFFSQIKQYIKVKEE